MDKTKKEQYTLLAFSLFPCIVWGVSIFGSLIFRHRVSYPTLLCYTAYRASYLLRALLFLFTLSHLYKKWLPNLYHSHQKLYVRYSLLTIIFIVFGFFIKTKFWNTILHACFISPFIEELMARFMLYEARHHGWKVYALAALFSSLTFSLMHIGCNPSVLTKPILLPKLSKHFLFGCILCSIFWFFPRLSLLVSIHAISNLWWILNMASELGAPW